MERRRRDREGDDGAVTQAKDISDDALLAALAATRGRTGVSRASCLWHVQAELATFPPKVVLAKLRSLMRRKIITGCGCGCRGDFELREIT